MKVVGLCGYSGAGKTTLVEHLIARLRLAGQRVSVVKHAHHGFDVDQPGKDSHRHREAGAFEVLIASNRRLAKMREFEQQVAPTVHQLLAELVPCDWVLVEGFKHSDVLKLEVWRPQAGKPAQYPHDPFVVAVCTDVPLGLPEPTGLPVLDLNDADAIVAFLMGNPQRYEYRSPFDDETTAVDAGAGAGAAARGRPAAG